MVSNSCLARVLPAATLLAITQIAGCSSATPTAPSTPRLANVAGTWLEPGRNFQWTLVQSGSTVTGTGSGIHPLEVPVTATLTGSVAGDTFTFSADESWSINGQTQVEHLFADGMQVTGSSMKGVVTFQPLFPPFRSISGTVTMVRLPQAQ